MVNINLSLSVPLNPPGASPIITLKHAWAAFVHKARRPQDFIPVVSSCTIISETPTSIACEVSFHPGVGHERVIREVCTLHPPCRIDYEIEGGSTAVNTISEMPDGELIMTFTFGWAHPDVEEGSDEERQLRDKHFEVSHPRAAEESPC